MSLEHEPPDGEESCSCGECECQCDGCKASRRRAADEIDYGFLSDVGKPDPADFDAQMHLMDSEPYGEIPAKGERIVLVVDNGALSKERIRRRDAEHLAVYGETPAQYRAKQRKGQTKPVGIEPLAQPSPSETGILAAVETIDILESNPAIADLVGVVMNQPSLTAIHHDGDPDWDHGDQTHFGPEYFHEKPEPKSATSNVIPFPTSHDQPPPIPNDSDAVWPQVIEDLDEVATQGPAIILDAVAVDMDERSQVGIKRYGVALQPFNGRDALRDAYAEALDQVVYLKQAYIESDSEAEMQEIDALYMNTLENTIQLRHMITLRDGLSK